MTEHIFNDLGYARLKKEVTAIATTFYLYDGGAAPFLPGWVAGKEMYLTLTDASSNIEIIKVTAISADILTVERGQDSSTAQIWHAGAIITQRLVAASLDQFIQKTGFRSIDYNPNGVLAAAYDGEKVYQTGGTACHTRWWKHTTGTKWRLIAGALCDNEYYDGDGYAQTRIFGEDWRDVSPDVSIAFKTVAYNGTDLWLAAGDDVYSSADGETWTQVSDQAGTAVIWDGTQFVMASGPYIKSSVDGVTWATRFTAASLIYSRFQDIAYDADSGTYIAVGKVGTTSWSYEPEIRVSTNLTNWTHRAPGSAYHEELYGVAAGDTHWVIVGITGEHQTAGIGSESTWTQRKSAASSQGRYGVCYATVPGVGGVFLSVGTYGYMYRSLDDGLTWTYYGGGGGKDAVYGINDVDPDLFCAVGESGGVNPYPMGTSWYGIAWEGTSLPVATPYLYGVATGDNKMIAVGAAAGKSVILITP